MCCRRLVWHRLALQVITMVVFTGREDLPGLIGLLLRPTVAEQFMWSACNRVLVRTAACLFGTWCKKQHIR